MPRTDIPSRNPSRSSCGEPTISRAKAVRSARRSRLSARGRVSTPMAVFAARADPSRQARAASRRRRGDGLRNLPRPSSAASAPAGGSVLPRRVRRRAAGSELSCASMRWPIKRKTGCDLETAALRVFSNAEGAYGANVGMLIDAGAWSDEDEISQTYARRKCFAYGRKGDCAPRLELLQSVLANGRFRLSEPGQRRTRRHQHRSLLRQPRRHGPRRRARAAAVASRRSTSPIRREERARFARSASRSRSRPERASSIRNGTKGCSSTATRASGRSKPT